MKSFKQFINESKEIDIDSICKQYKIKNYTINPDGSIDVDGDVNLTYQKLTELPLKFRNVTGHFDCEFNNLTSLEGCPKSVGHFFDCGNNQLTSLEGCPEIIGSGLFIINNQITNFKGISEYFENDFYCNDNPIFEIYRLFKNVECIKWINEFDVIRGNKVVMDLLEEVFHQLGMNIPENITFENYEII